jgi:2-phospho-L-lactate guanylyltransferase
MIAAVIPIKRLRDAKSRLADGLSARERANLVRTLLGRTLSIVRASGLVSRVALVTPEESLAGDMGVQVLPDGADLNSGLKAAAAWSIGVGARSLLILPGDLPLLQPNDLHALLSARAPGISVAQTPDGGTGALFLAPPDCIEPAFGSGSFNRHVELAQKAGIPVRIVQREGLTFDLDTSADLERLRRMGVNLLPGVDR